MCGLSQITLPLLNQIESAGGESAGMFTFHGSSGWDYSNVVRLLTCNEPAQTSSIHHGLLSQHLGLILRSPSPYKSKAPASILTGWHLVLG